MPPFQSLPLKFTYSRKSKSDFAHPYLTITYNPFACATFETETNDYLLLKRKQQKKKHKSQLEFRWICFSLVIVLAMTES